MEYHDRPITCIDLDTGLLCPLLGKSNFPVKSLSHEVSEI